MKITRRLFAVALPLGFVAVLSAQTPPPDAPHGPRPGRRPPSPLIRALDTDKSGDISAAELANAPAALRSLDTNGDGKLSGDELHPPRPADAPPPPPANADRPRPVDPVMFALDTNHDGELSAEEIANATTSLKALDLNGDGKLTFDELRPLPPDGTPHRDGSPPRD